MNRTTIDDDDQHEGRGTIFWLFVLVVGWPSFFLLRHLGVL